MRPDPAQDTASHPVPSLIRNALSNYVALGVNLLVMLLLTPLVVRSLGQVGYGVWVLVGTIVGYAGLLDLGVSKALNRDIAKHAARGETEALNATLGSAMAFLLVIGASASFLVVSQADTIAAGFELSSQSHSLFRMTICILGVTIGISLPTRVFVAALTSREAFIASNTVGVLIQLLSAALMVLVLLTGYGLVGIASVQCVMAVVSAAMHYAVCRRLFPKMRFSPSGFRYPHFRSLISYGLFAVLWVLADQLRFNGPAIVVGTCISVGAVALYSIGSMLVIHGTRLFTVAQSVFAPRFTALDSRGDETGLRELFLLASKAAAILAVVLCGLMVFLARPFIEIWFGDSYSSSYGVLVILVPAFCVARSQTISVPVLYGKGKHRGMAVVMLCEGLFNLLLGVLLAPHWGILGVAVGAAIPMLLVYLFIQPRYVCRVIGLNAGRYYREVLLRPWCVFALAWLCGGLPQWLGDPTAVTIMASLLLWAGISWMLLRRSVLELIALRRRGAVPAVGLGVPA